MQQTIHVVTSFSGAGYSTYGKTFIDTFLECWPEYVHLHVFTDGMANFELTHPRLCHYLLEQDAQHEKFVIDYAGQGFNHPTDFNMMGVRFCHKVFAITSPKLPHRGWRVWIDADVKHVKRVDEVWLSKVLPISKGLSYLGRTGRFRPGQEAYTECGFVGYNLEKQAVQIALGTMRSIYASGEVFNQGQFNWHDSYTFDRVRKSCVDPLLWHDLSGPYATTMHPWPHTLLGEVMIHSKGPRRKAATYGP